ncbi:MAG: HupE/UreJ family protein, partial [Proteobacteria bacterium]
MKNLTLVSLRSFAFSLIYLLTSLSGTIALAHDVKGTVIYVDLWRDHVSFQFEMPVDELSFAFGKDTEPGITPLPATTEEIATYVLNHSKVQTPDGKAFTLTALVGESILHDSRNWQQIIVNATPPAGASPREYTLTTDVINHQVVSHHIFIFLRSDFETGQIAEPVYLDTLHYQMHESHFKRAPGSLQLGLWSIFRLGMSHIAEGTDHLLFLFTLLLPAGLMISARRRWGERGSARQTTIEIAKIVTAFTLGHSITLLAGTLGIATLPTQFVESMIAASVLISAAHAVYPIFPGKEALIALMFGLIHG